MKKKITITESELRNLVEAAINELDWKTYMNAADKVRNGMGRKDVDRLGREYGLQNAAGRAYKDKWKRAIRWCGFEPSVEDFQGIARYNLGEPGQEIYTYNRVNPGHARRHDKWSAGIDGDRITDYDKRYRKKVKWHPELRDMQDYYWGRSQYTPGKGWNEALVRDLTEAVIRGLRERDKKG